MKSNDLIEGSYQLPMFETRLLNLAITKIQPNKPQPPEGYRITAKEFVDVYKCDPNSIHSNLISAIKNIKQSSIRLYNCQWAGEFRDFIDLSWCTAFSYISSKTSGTEGCVTIKFSPEIEPCLFELQKKFTQLNFDDLAKLDTPFSVRLYSWIACNKWNGNEVTLEIEWMKNRAGLSGKYNEYKAFRVRVLQPAIDKINSQSSDFSITYIPIRDGKLTKYIKFTVTSKNLIKDEVKPIRPRLPRRPKVTSGSKEEGEWARKGIKILTQYAFNIEKFNKNLDLADAKRLVTYFEIIGDKDNSNAWKEHIRLRNKHKTKVVKT